MGCKLGKDSSLPLLKKLFLLLLFVSEVHPAPLLSKGGSSVYVIFDRIMKKLTKIKVFRSDSEVNISPLPSELCLLQLTSLTKRFPNDPAPTLLSRMELPSGSIAIYWRQLALSCSQLLSLVHFGLKLSVLTAVYFLNRIPSSVISGLSLRTDFLPRLTMKSFESIGGGCGGNPRSAASSRAGRPAA